MLKNKLKIKVTFDGFLIFKISQADLSTIAPSKGTTGNKLKKLNERLSPALKLKNSVIIRAEMAEQT